MSTRLVGRMSLAVLLILVMFQSLAPVSTSAASSLHYLFGSGSQTGGRRILLRVALTEPAPSGGATVSLTSSNPAIQVPATIRVNSGETARLFTVSTTAVTSDTVITISATYAGVTKSRPVLLKASRLKSLTVQQVIRHGGIGRIMIALTGPAPTGGFAVTGASLPGGILDFPLDTYTVPAGKDRLILSVPANLMGTTNIADDRLPSQTVEVRVDDGSRTLTAEALVKDFGNNPRPTATSTNTPTDTATSTTTDTATPADTATSVPTSSPTTPSTNTPVPTTTPMPGSVTVQLDPFDAGTGMCQVNVTLQDAVPGFWVGVNIFESGGGVATPVLRLPSSPTGSFFLNPGHSVVAGTASYQANGQSVPVSLPGGVCTVTATASPTNTSTSTATAAPTSTNTPLPTNTSTPLPTSTNTPVPPATNTPVPTSTYTPVPPATNTPVPTSTNTPAPPATNTPVPTATPTGGGGGGGGCLIRC